MKEQRGLSALGLLCLLILGGFVVLCLFKIGPLYYNNHKLNTIFDRVGTEGIPLENQTNAQIRSRISAQFSVDGVRDVDVKDIQIERQNGEVTLLYPHEDRATLFGNLDVIAVFENRFSTADEG